MGTPSLRLTAVLTLAALLSSPIAMTAQKEQEAKSKSATPATPTLTKVTTPKNKYKPAEDVKLGLEAAAQVRKELPIMKDEQVQTYVSALGKKLEAVIPAEYQ